MKGAANVLNALQHINTISTMLRKTLVDFSGTPQKDQLVDPGPMLHFSAQTDDEPRPFHNHRHYIFWMGKPCQSLIIDVSKNTFVWYFGFGKPRQIWLIDLSQKTCIWYFGMGRPFPWARSIVSSYLCVQYRSKYWLWWDAYSWMLTYVRYFKSLFWMLSIKWQAL